jgi:3-phenylpropionate/trans-cinnamate dioxygenase ferredoxin reductase component
VPGAELDGVLYLRSLADCEAIKKALASARRVAIIGAGWIGLETAAAARARGLRGHRDRDGRATPLAMLGRELGEI